VVELVILFILGGHGMIEIISENLKTRIEECFSEADNSIRIVSPFMSVKTAKMLCELKKRKPELECSFITRIYLKDLLDSVNSLEALEMLLDAKIKVYALQGLHAKLYSFDEEKVAIGSANFTLAGLSKNFELSVFTDEESVVIKAGNILDELEAYCFTHDGCVNKELVSYIKQKYDEAYRKRQKDCGVSSTSMYGAKRICVGATIKSDDDWRKEEINVVEYDPVFSLMNGEAKRKTDFKHNIWAKFEGKSEDRQPGNEVPTLSKVELDGENKFIINFRNRPRGIHDGDQLYIVSLTSDEKGKPTTRIVGRGRAKAYQNKNCIHQEWVKEYPWMSYYRYFCEIVDIELLNLNRMDCMPLDQVYDALGKKTYVSTIDKEEVKNMSLCQCRRSHIQMTLDAKEYIDTEIDKLVGVHGFIEDIQSRR